MAATTYAPPPQQQVAVSPVTITHKLKFFKNLIYGGFAGFVGSLCTFPIDTAKTRLQEQVKLEAGKTSPFKGGPYTGIFNCLGKMFVQEGPFSLYKGIPVQLIGIIPEKALKLSVNDYFRYTLSHNGRIELHNEAIAGGLAGFCQVVVTSPMEMLKIRMQLQNKKPEAERQRIGQVVRSIVNGGLRGIYQGAAATLLRDVPFSILYFPLFSNLKLYMAMQPSNHPIYGSMRRPNTDHLLDSAARVNLLGTFMAGLVAGSVSAVAVTPADVIKTRLQSEGGLQKYVNIRQCTVMTAKEGGLAAFFKGATGRLMLIGPLFGVVLATYEFMPKYLPL